MVHSEEEVLLSIEALVFASESSISIDEIVSVLRSTFETDFEAATVKSLIEKIEEKYASAHAIEIKELNGGYQFLTKNAYHPIINQLQLQRSKKKLSQAALETLAIIAYRQPITKLEVEQIRGVNCDYTIQKLLERELITISGKSDTVGKPILYSTGNLFMDYFGINDKSQLPKLQDLVEEVNEIGEKKE